jgi:hypothetical protein
MHVAQLRCNAISRGCTAITRYIAYHIPEKAKLPLRFISDTTNGFIAPGS